MNRLQRSRRHSTVVRGSIELSAVLNGQPGGGCRGPSILVPTWPLTIRQARIEPVLRPARLLCDEGADVITLTKTAVGNLIRSPFEGRKNLGSATPPNQAPKPGKFRGGIFSSGFHLNPSKPSSI